MRCCVSNLFVSRICCVFILSLLSFFFFFFGRQTHQLLLVSTTLSVRCLLERRGSGERVDLAGKSNRLCHGAKNRKRKQKQKPDSNLVRSLAVDCGNNRSVVLVVGCTSMFSGSHFSPLAAVKDFSHTKEKLFI